MQSLNLENGLSFDCGKTDGDGILQQMEWLSKHPLG